MAARCKEVTQAVDHRFMVHCLAFPNGEHAPPRRFQSASIRLIPFFGAPNLGTPIVSIALGAFSAASAPVAVPVAAMHKQDSAVLRKHQVRLPRKVGAMKSEPKARPVR